MNKKARLIPANENMPLSTRELLEPGTGVSHLVTGAVMDHGRNEERQCKGTVLDFVEDCGCDN